MTIDWWTLGLQTINILVLIWLLGHFFWSPMAAMIEQRQQAVRKTLAEAEAQRSQAAAVLAEIAQKRAGFAQERDAILKSAQEIAERERTALLEQSAKEAAALEAAAKAAIAKEKHATEKMWADQASRLAVDIAGRLAARLEGPAVRAAFLDWLLKEIRSLPGATRQAVAVAGAALEVISAAPLEAADQQRYSELIADAFGTAPKIDFKTDAALIMGLELYGPHLVVANSWRADLSQILTDLAHDSSA